MTPEKTVAIRDYLIAEHVPYEIWMMRKTHDTIIAGALTNKVALNAFIESFAIHERALIDFFNGRKGNDAAHFTVETYTRFATGAIPKKFTDKISMSANVISFARISSAVTTDSAL